MMGHRPHFYISKRVPCDGGESPNAFVPAVTVEIRVFYPSRQKGLAQTVLDQAVEEAQAEMRRRLVLDTDYPEVK